MLKLDMALVFRQEFAVRIHMEISNEDNMTQFPMNVSLNIFSLDKLRKEVEVLSCIFEKQII